ncbi:HD domain-containing protein [Brucepastera parasyntrophica]|uniref:HD domain-containing protein n=1 Tax=Brucepastera parasyntrophica TaxID=2880008 RepID=UPI00210B4023|nr:HD domain-containing protein [Brucepastera parasyntrophica]ULQ60200.1 HD domain-containing protein [Brucepastera parasyntrophica]
MFNRSFVLKIFEGFSLERWNDLVRPFPLIEIDKSAEKAVLAYIIGKFEEKNGTHIDWSRIIYGSFFDLLRKIVLSDIKAPVQRMIRNEYPDEYKKLNEWVLDQYIHIISDKKLFQEFSDYVLGEPDTNDITWRVLRAAHKYSTMREVELLTIVNEPFRLIEVTKNLNRDIEEFLDLRGLQLLITKQTPYDFLMEIERLRFQTRWNQTPRIPATSVLGHSYFVAALTLLLSREIGAPAGRFYNNFFSALFHDLPEAVTRDIISPVKQATDHLPAIVKEIEDKIVEKELVPLMDESFRSELMYFTSNEFCNRILNSEGQVEFVDFQDLQTTYSNDACKPVDGKLVRAADQIAAFVEADSSIRYGISSSHLEMGRKNIFSQYSEGTLINGIDIGALLAEFRNPNQLDLF